MTIADILGSKPDLDSLASRIVALSSKAVRAASPKYGCLMAMLPSLKDEIVEFAHDGIALRDLAEDGVEDEPHVTMLYGFDLGFDSSKLADYCSEPIEIEIGKLSKFECEDYDVVKFDIISPQLEAIHKELAEDFADSITPSKWDYHPHLTVAYVKKGASYRLDGKQFEGRKLTVDHCFYSLPKKKGRVKFFSEAIDASSRQDSDAVRAAETDLSRLSVIRSKAEDRLRKAVNSAIDSMAVEFLHSQPRDEQDNAYNFLTLFEEAGHAGFKQVSDRLNSMEGVQESPEALESLADQFVVTRAPLVRDWHQRTWERFEKAVQEGRQAGEGRRALWARLRDLADTVKVGSGNVVVETEAQAGYGAAQLRALTQAGYTSKLWVTVGDDRVRHSHASQDNEERPIDQPFSNGLQYPGDPNGGPEDNCGCRCWLTGGEKPVVKESRQVRRANERKAAKALRRALREAMV